MPIWHQSPKLTPRYFLETPRLFGYPFLCGYKPLLPARVSRRCFHFVQAIAFDSRQPSKGFIFFYFFLFAFSCLYACCSASENGFEYSFTLILSIAISCISCSRIYFSTVASFNPTVLT